MLTPVARRAGRMAAMWLLVLAGAVASAQAPETIKVVAAASDGNGLLCESQGKSVLIVAGTPEQMGTAHGALLREKATALTTRILYGVGGAYSLHKGDWFFERMAEIERRTGPHVPARFLAECDALSAAAGISARDGRHANFFPEMFHCSGVAVRGKATKGGRLLHARVLDYMRDIGLQNFATVTLFQPEGHYSWMTLGYAGFIGTVTALNERGLAVGEMGGRGEGDWDGMPMNFLLRDIMERAATVAEALEILRNTPRTCEYYYILSDKSRAMAGVHCTSAEMTVLQPGQQDARLPLVPEDTVFVSGGDRAKHLSERIQAAYGTIDVPAMIEIIKRPVAMSSNLHNAIFAPETLDMWAADAGKHTPACNEPYAHFNIGDLMRFYRAQTAE